MILIHDTEELRLEQQCKALARGSSSTKRAFLRHAYQDEVCCVWPIGDIKTGPESRENQGETRGFMEKSSANEKRPLDPRSISVSPPDRPVPDWRQRLMRPAPTSCGQVQGFDRSEATQSHGMPGRLGKSPWNGSLPPRVISNGIEHASLES